MGELKAGAARIALEPKIGTNLIGYAGEQKTLGIHDPIHGRALVLDDGKTTVALCSIEVCLFTVQDTARMRQAITAKTPIPAENIFVFAIHTHAAPAFWEAEDWVRPPEESLADAVAAAYAALQPAAIGFGFGQLQGYSINRRFMNRPVDPSIGVMRVDTSAGEPLALLGNYGNHAVVLGYDNEYVSADWPGYSSTKIEADLGDNFVALFSQGGAGDVNPLTETVRQQLAAGHPVEAIGATSTMYGRYDENDAHSWNIGDRGGGAFVEAETIALAYNSELLRVWRTIEPTTTAPLWVKTIMVDGTPSADELADAAKPYTPNEHEDHKDSLSDRLGQDRNMEVMLVGIGEALLVGHPGETFSENAVELRKLGQQMGIKYPLLVTYANGWLGYLTPANAYAEGGYEVGVSQRVGVSQFVQDRIMAAILPQLQTYTEKQ